MRRVPSTPRANFAEEAKRIGFHFADLDGTIYWDESVRYEFSMAEIETIETATRDLADLCLELTDQIIGSEVRLMQLQIPRHAWDLIAESWRRRDASLYGRFDFVYDGMRPPKLLEYNADTPTSLFEAGVVQWFWLEQLIASGELANGSDQFNSLHEKLIARWGAIADRSFLHLACQTENIEDRSTVEYLAECAGQAGLRSAVIGMGDVGLRGRGFVDRDGRAIDYLFKLYPWEWMLADTFGKSEAVRHTRFIEPPWKMVLSNKGILALLWDFAPNHPNLLPAYFERDPRSRDIGDQYARKPLFSREGNNIELVDRTRSITGPNDGYGAEGFVRQQLCMLPDFSGNFPVIGSWVIGEEAAGMGIREDRSLITSNTARFIPHVIEPA
jgi:glutathionylspermidine synthase